MILLEGGGSLSLVTPDLGLLFWTTLVFLLLWFLLGKFAFRPITKALQKRENDIDGALKAAEEARAEMATLKADNERVLNEAKEERARIIKDSKEIGQKLIEDAKSKAQEEARRVTEDAMAEIQNQKMAAIIDVKNLIGNSSVDLAKKVLSRDLNDANNQESYIEQEIARMNLN